MGGRESERATEWQGEQRMVQRNLSMCLVAALLACHPEAGSSRTPLGSTPLFSPHLRSSGGRGAGGLLGHRAGCSGWRELGIGGSGDSGDWVLGLELGCAAGHGSMWRRLRGGSSEGSMEEAHVPSEIDGIIDPDGNRIKDSDSIEVLAPSALIRCSHATFSTIMPTEPLVPLALIPKISALINTSPTLRPEPTDETCAKKTLPSTLNPKP